MAGMIGLFLEVTLFGKFIKGAVLNVTIFYLADAILRRGRIFVTSFLKVTNSIVTKVDGY